MSWADTPATAALVASEAVRWSKVRSTWGHAAATFFICTTQGSGGSAETKAGKMKITVKTRIHRAIINLRHHRTELRQPTLTPYADKVKQGR